MAKSKNSGTQGKTRIFVVDDHPLVRQGIRLVVSQEPDMVVCGEADDATEAAVAIAAAKPDLAVVDLSLKRNNGLDLIKDLRKRCPEVPVLVMSMHEQSYYAERVLHAGARGYITKAEGAQRLIDGIRQVLKGQIFLNERLSAKLISKLVSGRAAPAATLEDRLSDRELAIFELIGNGLSNREIAERLCLSRKTVDCHREHIKEKLDLSHAADILKEAIRWVQSKQNGL
jgi:DNA-binding NarL/FixJ family response regulator